MLFFRSRTSCLVLLFLALVGGLATSIGAGQKETAWDGYKRAGVAAFKNEDYVEAEKQFNAALEESGRFGPYDPRTSVTLIWLIDIYKSEGNCSMAIRSQVRLLKIEEDVSRVRRSRGCLGSS